MIKIFSLFLILYSSYSYAEDFYYSDQSQAINDAISYGNVVNHECMDCWCVFYSSDTPANPNAGIQNLYYYPSPYTKYTETCISEYESIGIDTTFSGVNDSQLVFIYSLLGIICAMCFIIPISLQIGR